MRTRRDRRRRDLPNRLELPGSASISALARLRKVVAPEKASALDVIDAERRAAIARAPGHFRLGLRLSFVAVVVAGLFSVLLVRLWSIQVIHASSAQQGALTTLTREIPTPAPRGPILASGGQPLAVDKSELVVTLKTSTDYNTTPVTRVASATTEANLAALIPNLTVAAIRKQLNNEQYGPYTPVPVAEGISVNAATTIDENPSEFPGAQVSSEYVRDYPQGLVASQLLGYLGPLTCSAGLTQAQCSAELLRYENEGYQPTDLIGTAGLESQYEQYLRGKAGIARELVDAQGSAGPTVSTTQPTPGDSVVLNMDLPLEQTLATALETRMQALRTGPSPVPADWGAAVVLGPKGQVLAMDSNPSYNNNEWVGGISDAAYQALQTQVGEPLNNYALMGLQPPGSTFKLATATAALDDGLISPYSDINDPGYFDLPGGQRLTDSGGESFGYINVSTALTVSSDVFFYNLGANFWDDRGTYGTTPIQNMAAKYGFGQPSGIDLPGEESGWIDSTQNRKTLHAVYPALYGPETWYLADNVEMAFGQGETVVTPLEEANAYSTFANGGTRYAPEMAGAIVSPIGKVVKLVQPKVEAKVPLPASTYEAMLAGFEGAVQNPKGTAYYDFTGFNFKSWDIAGKTGTADVASSTKQPTAWFVAFGGPRNDPSQRYTVAVEIDQAGYGADAAAPVARQVFNYLYAHGAPKLDVAAAGGSGG